MPKKVLITKAQYDKLPPLSQGFAQYWEGSHIGSELSSEANPYPEGSKERAEWDRGEALAVQEAQDSEE